MSVFVPGSIPHPLTCRPCCPRHLPCSRHCPYPSTALPLPLPSFLIPHSSFLIPHPATTTTTAPALTPATALPHPHLCLPTVLTAAAALTFLQYLALINGPPLLSWLCAAQPFPMVRLCVMQGMPLDFVSMELPHRHLVSSLSGVEGSLKCLPLLPLFFLTISSYGSKGSLLHISTTASIHRPLI